MNVFLHHIYEYEKGIRKLVLHTLHKKHEEFVINRLKSCDIPYIIQYLDNDRFNVFFGNELCIATLERIGNKPLNRFSPEEDFILGIMLGYDRLIQCERYLKTSNKKEKQNESFDKLRINNRKYAVNG
ncbi:MAG: hypothetical protein CSB55_07230 [Candidatus Cloacimonadota bacterium]|nr:MAG: hypothetical protein CSB55_07230 [Candidatus Cloacimonadota bacterium]